jgi:hypothetical protein
MSDVWEPGVSEESKKNNIYMKGVLVQQTESELQWIARLPL